MLVGSTQGKSLSDDEMRVVSQAITDSEFTPEAGLEEALRDRTRSISRRNKQNSGTTSGSGSSSSGGLTSYRLRRYGIEAGGQDIAVRPDLDLLRFPEDQVGGAKVKEQRRQQLRELRRFWRQQQEPQQVAVLREQQRKWLQRQQQQQQEEEMGQGSQQQAAVRAEGEGERGAMVDGNGGKQQQGKTQGPLPSGSGSVVVEASVGASANGEGQVGDTGLLPSPAGGGGVGGVLDWQKAAAAAVQSVAEGLGKLQGGIQKQQGQQEQDQGQGKQGQGKEQQREEGGGSPLWSGWFGGVVEKLESLTGLSMSDRVNSSQAEVHKASSSSSSNQSSVQGGVRKAIAAGGGTDAAGGGGSGSSPTAGFRAPAGMMSLQLLQKERSRALIEEMLQISGSRYASGLNSSSSSSTGGTCEGGGVVIVVLTSCGVQAIEDAWQDLS